MQVLLLPKRSKLGISMSSEEPREGGTRWAATPPGRLPYIIRFQLFPQSNTSKFFMTDMCVAIDIITGFIRNGRLQGIATRAKVQVGANVTSHVDQNKAFIQEYRPKTKYLGFGHAPIFVSGGTVIEWPAARSMGERPKMKNNSNDMCIQGRQQKLCLNSIHKRLWP